MLEQHQQPPARGIGREHGRQHGQGDPRLVAELRDAAVAGVEVSGRPAPRPSAGNGDGNNRGCPAAAPGNDALPPNCSIQGCSSGGTACEVSWPPIQSVGSVKTTRAHSERRQCRGTAAQAAADDHHVGGDLAGPAQARPGPGIPDEAASNPASPAAHPSRKRRRFMGDSNLLARSTRLLR